MDAVTVPPALPARSPRPPGFVRVLRRELHEIAHSPFYYLFTFILPLAAFGIMTAIFYDEMPRDIPVVVWDADGSAASRELLRRLEASSSIALVRAVYSVEEGAAQIRQGKAYCLICVPADFGRDALRGDMPAVVAFSNNQWFLVSSIIGRALRDVVGTFSAEWDLRARMASGDSAPAALAKLEPIRVDTHLLFNPSLNYRFLLLPALLPGLLQAFIIMVVVRAVGRELRHGTAGDWMAAAGGRITTAVSAKLLPYTLGSTAMTVFMLALLVRFMNVPFNGNPWVFLAASALFVLAYQSMGLLLVAIAGNLRLANSLAGFYTGPALAFAGITYPYVGMPAAAKVWSNAIPLTHYLSVIIQQALRGAPPQASADSVLVLAAFALVPALFALPRLKRLANNPASWGRL